jgi:ABC-2 type transport system ATP-binding protein
MHAQPEHAVLTRGLTKRFGDFTAVDNVDLAVRSGEIFGFLGANGAGKTTTIRMLCGLLVPSAGEAWVDGLPISSSADQVKRRIGYMSQRFSLYMDLTIGENLEFFGGVYGLSALQIAERGKDVAEQLGLSAFLNRLPVELPPGYRQRLALGCSVLHQPRMLFLDEPTGGVDPVARRTFWDLIYKRSDEGATVFVTTHYMDEAEYCHRLALMYKGKIIALDPPAALRQAAGKGSMEEVFVSMIEAEERGET